MSVPKLYLIATPLGNLDDITLRALNTLAKLKHVFAEDSREVAKLLAAHKVPSAEKKLHSYSSHNMKAATDVALRLLEEGNEIGFVCDRGTPAISDPGFLLVDRARDAGYGVTPIPGPSSVMAALSVAGVDTDSFFFAGFLPTQPKERRELLDKASSSGSPVCFFESPRRVRETLTELKEIFPAGKIFIAREMTKVFENFSWHDLSTLAPETVPELGEFTLVLSPGPRPTAPEDWEVEVALRAASEKEWSKKIAERHGVPAATIYNALQKVKPPKN